MRGVVVAPLVALAAACSDAPRLVPIDLFEAPSGVGFLVVYRQGELVSEAGPFGVEDGELSFGALPQVRLQPEDRVVVLVVPTAAIEAAVPGFTSDDLPATRLVHFAATPAAVQTDGQVMEELALPAATRFWQADASGRVGAVGADAVGDLVGGRGVRVFYDPESCRPPGTGVLTPYGGLSDPLAAARVEVFGASLVDVHILDERHLLTWGDGALVLVTRGEALTEADWSAPPPRALFVGTDFMAQRFRFVDIDAVAVDPTSPPEARRALVIAADTDNLTEPELAISALAWVHITQDGLTITETATVVDTHLRDVDFAPDGSWLAVGDYGRAYFGGPGPGAAVTATQYGDDQSGEARRGAWTPDPTRPWVVSARSAFYTYFSTLGRWVAQPVRGKVDENLHFVALGAAEAAGQVEIWSGGAGGLLYASRGGSEFEFVSPRTPPRLGACSQQLGTPRPLYVQDVNDVAFADGRVFILSDDCTAIMQVRLHDGCTSLLTLEGTEILAANRILRGMDIADGALVAVGRDGHIWETPLR